jgi:hypothetical protein
MDGRLLVGAVFIVACGGSVDAAGDAGDGDGSPFRDASVNEAAPPVDVVDGALSCGGTGQPCCGTSCHAGNTCVVIDMTLQCEACAPGTDCGGSVVTADDAGHASDADDAEVAATLRDADANETAPPVNLVDGALSCGVPGQPCCGTSCNVGNTCVVIDMKSQCEACGGPGQVCCTTMPACADPSDDCFYGGALQYCMNVGEGTLGQPGDQCAITCVDPSDTCFDYSMSSTCRVCGGLGNPCCGDTCGMGLQCTAGYCQ